MNRIPCGQPGAIATAIVVLLISAASSQAKTDIMHYRGADREQKLIEGARKEGQVILYSALIVNQMLRPLSAGFMKKYPFVKMTYWRGGFGETLPRLFAQARGHHP